MLVKLSNALLVVLAFVWLASAAPSPFPYLVPRIDINGFQLEPSEKGYFLSVRHPDGGSVQEETVHELAPGQLEVSGQINQKFADQETNLIVQYEAGAKGYVAKYNYGTNIPKLPITRPPPPRPTTRTPITFRPPPPRPPLTVPPPALHGCTLKTCSG